MADIVLLNESRTSVIAAEVYLVQTTVNNPPGATELNALIDVDLDLNAPLGNGDTLIYDATLGKWITITPSGQTLNISDNSDPAIGYFLEVALDLDATFNADIYSYGTILPNRLECFGGGGTFYGPSSGTISCLAIGRDAGLTWASGTPLENTAIGWQTLKDITNQHNNTAVGSKSQYLSIGFYNVSLGGSSLKDTQGNHNTAVGYQAGKSIRGGKENVSMGSSAGGDGVGNVAIGYLAHDITGGSYNTFLGHWAGYSITGMGSNNIFIGKDSGRSVSPAGGAGGNNTICIGDNSIITAFIKVAWTVTSDLRDKADITDFTYGLEYINYMRPVTFVWDDRSDYEDFISDGSKKKSKLELGFIAQEVAEIESRLGINNNCIIDSSDVNLFKIRETKIIPVLVNAVKELSTKLDILEASIKEII